MRLKIFTLTFLVAFGFSLDAQDIHFTQFNMQPMTLNPAFTGAFLGSIRVGGIYRSQWASVTDNEFVTPSLFVDIPLIKGFRDQDWVGIGISFYDDKAGALSLKNTAFHGSIAYHLAFNKKQTSSLTLGIQYGSIKRKGNWESFIDESEVLLSGTADPYLSGLQGGGSNAPDASLSDLNAGLLLKSQLNEQMSFNLGFSAAHLTTPVRNDFQASVDTMPGGPGGTPNRGEKLSVLSTLHGELNAQLTDKLDLTPAFIARFFGSASEYGFHAILGYGLAEDIRLRMGLGYRLTGGDATELFLGVDYEGWRVMASYDVNMSDLTAASNNKGGFELAAQRIFKFYKKPKPTPVFLCPKYY